MGLVLWIDQNTFSNAIIEKVFKRRNMAFYTLTSANDFLYLVEDLKPSILVLDHSTAMRDLNLLQEQFQKSQILRDLPVLFIESDKNFDFIKNRSGVLQRPIDPFQIPEIISSKLRQN